MKIRLYFDGAIDIEVDQDDIPGTYLQPIEGSAGDIAWADRKVFEVLAGKTVDELAALEIAVDDVSPICRVCGCTNELSCPGGCRWVEVDLCSTHGSKVAP